MIRQVPNRRRSGYTLIELLVASAIATLLMLALYSAFDVTVTQTDLGRERVAHTDLARSIVTRMGGDIAATMGLLQPQSGQPYAGASSGSSSSDPTSSSSTSTSSSTTVVDVTSATADDSGYAKLLPMELGMYGDSQSLTMFVTKVPQWQLQRTPLSDPANSDPTTVLPTDLRRVTYYVGNGGGLCRQERLWATAPGTGDAITLDTSNESQEVLAPEVTSLTFEYFDANGWQSSWDGTTVTSDGSAMLGAPRAVRVTLTFEVHDDNGQTYSKTVQHVFPVRSAIGLTSTLSSASVGGQMP